MDLQFTKDPAVLKWIRFDLYSPLDVALILAGTVLWCVAYFIIVRNAFKNKFVDMPIAAGAANIAWEFVWAFMVVTDMGLLFVYGLRVWFLMDILILYTTFKYGSKQILNKRLAGAFVWTEPFVLIAWGFLFWFFIKEGYDTSMGATSAYVITTIMEFVYITTFLNHDQKYFSFHVAWTKGVANFLMTLFVFNHYAEGMWFLKTMTIIVTVLDIIYIVMVAKAKYFSNPRINQSTQS
jgi:hypothetical protein